MSHCTCVAFALQCTRRCLRNIVRGGVCVTLYEEVFVLHCTCVAFASHCTRRCLRYTVRRGVCVTLYVCCICVTLYEEMFALHCTCEEVSALHCTCVAFASQCTRRCLRYIVRGGVCVTLYEEVFASHCTYVAFAVHCTRCLRYTVREVVCITLYEEMFALHCTCVAFASHCTRRCLHYTVPVRRCLRYTVRVLHLHHTVRGGVCITLYEEVFASHCTCVAFALHCTYEEVHQDTGLSEMCRDGQIQIYTVYIRYYLLGFREIYGHVRGTYKQFWPTSEMCFGLPLACMIAQL